MLSQHPDTVFQRIKGALSRDRVLILMSVPMLVFFIVFCYIPMAGVFIAFQDFMPRAGFFGSKWVGLTWFKDFFSSIYVGRLIRNTVLLSVYSIIVGFPMPIVLALLLNEVHNMRFKKVVQTISYMPYFISTVVLVGIMMLMMQYPNGIINKFLMFFGFKGSYFFQEPGMFRTIYIISGIWQGVGFGSILYLAVLSGINPEIYESAVIDGANRFQQMIHISLPSMKTTIGTMLILSIGGIFSVGHEKIILMYNPTIYETADVISTYVYRRGILSSDFSFATAVGLFNSVVNFLVLFVANKLSNKFTEVSIW
jgi:putative aldouronate transport system permease protein